MLGYSSKVTLLKNKKAHLDYAFLEKFEAGLELLGFEVKSLRAGRGNLEGARVVVRGGEAYVVGMTIPPYQAGNTPQSYDPERPRKLLLNQAEIARVTAAEGAKGLTVVPISVYNGHRNLKLEVAIARGKKQYDKRQDLKKREAKRAAERALKN